MALHGYRTLLRLVSLLFIAIGAAEFEQAEHKSPNIYHVPAFSVTSLRTGSRSEELASVLSTTGIIAIELDDDEGFDAAREAALGGLCQCANSAEFRSMEGTDFHSTTLRSDRSTLRTTFATATVGNTPLVLPQDSLTSASCSVETTKGMDELRDYVAHASRAFVSSLDRLLSDMWRNDGDNHGGRETTRQTLLRTVHGASYSTIVSIVKASKNLEHFHVYSKEHTASDTKVLDVHTDAGLFLAFVPGRSCQNDASNTHFYIQDERQQVRAAVFPPNSIGIMLGAGAEHWIDNVPLQLRATKHAVHMEPGEARAWYGMMHLVPQHAIVQQQQQGEEYQQTFADMQRAIATSKDSDGVLSIGCGNSYSSMGEDTSPMAAIQARRRLEHITDGSTCNNVTNFFCWMTCQEIPELNNVQDNIDEGKSLYCLEPSVLASSSQVSGAVASCTEDGEVGAAMNEACIGSWQPTAQGVPSQQVRTDVAPQDLDEPFCYGGTTMYMDGFHWLDPTCVIYLFPAWVLTTPASIVGACIGTLIFGVTLEGVIRARRMTVQSMPSGWRQLGVSTMFYGMQLTMGYMLMLVVMTYSWPLFLCVVVGLMMGHACFNSPWFNKKQAVECKKDDGSCCNGETNHVESEATSEADCCERQQRSTVSSESPFVPEGSTPCCQNAL